MKSKQKITIYETDMDLHFDHGTQSGALRKTAGNPAEVTIKTNLYI